MKYFFWSLAAFILSCGAMVQPAAAATLRPAPQSLQIQGLSIDPFLIEADVEAGGSIERSITLTNTTDKPISFAVSVNDFVVKGNNGQPLFLKADEQGNPKFSLSSWVKIIRQPNFTIPPQGQTTVVFAITPPQGAEPGTHYGGILFGQSIQAGTPSTIGVEHKAGAIILVRLGKAQEQVKLSEFFTQHSVYQHPPVEFGVTAHNFGNVHSKPKGDIVIRNMFGKTVGEVPVNPDANIVLPESARDFFQRWEPKFAFGRYTAEAVLYYGNPKLELRDKTAFWILPTRTILLALGGLLILAIIAYRSLKAYNRYIIKKSSL